jgi:hypothetical protein
VRQDKIGRVKINTTANDNMNLFLLSSRDLLDGDDPGELEDQGW